MFTNELFVKVHEARDNLTANEYKSIMDEIENIQTKIKNYPNQSLENCFINPNISLGSDSSRLLECERERYELASRISRISKLGTPSDMSLRVPNESSMSEKILQRNKLVDDIKRHQRRLSIDDRKVTLDSLAKEASDAVDAYNEMKTIEAILLEISASPLGACKIDLVDRKLNVTNGALAYFKTNPRCMLRAYKDVTNGVVKGIYLEIVINDEIRKFKEELAILYDDVAGRILNNESFICRHHIYKFCLDDSIINVGALILDYLNEIKMTREPGTTLNIENYKISYINGEFHFNCLLKSNLPFKKRNLSINLHEPMIDRPPPYNPEAEVKPEPKRGKNEECICKCICQ
jgi:hypothetical protein